jgi:hypothetical protein
MTYEEFLKPKWGQHQSNNIYFVRLSFEGDWLEFEINNEEDFINVTTLQYNRLNFKEFRNNTLFKECFKSAENN